MTAAATALPRLRAALEGVPVYRAGQPAGDDAGKLSANENPFAPLPSVLVAVEGAATALNRYPDPASTLVTEAIAARHGVVAERVAVGAGSVALCQQLVQATATTGDEILFAWRSFEAYPIVAQLADATPRPVSLTSGGEHDLEAISPQSGAGPGSSSSATRTTRPAGPCRPPTSPRSSRPCRPTSSSPSTRPTSRFARDPDVTSATGLLDTHPNVCVLRTFSKAYGLAGLRIGYALAHPTVTQALRKTTTTFAVTALAQHAAIASLAAADELAARVTEVIALRDRLRAALRRQGWPVGPSAANFLWIEDDGRATAFVRACAQAGLTVRAFPSEGIRVTVGAAHVNDRLARAAANAATQVLAP